MLLQQPCCCLLHTVKAVVSSASAGTSLGQICPGACFLLTCQLLLLHQPRCGGHEIGLVGLIGQLGDDDGRPHRLVLACLQHAKKSMQRLLQLLHHNHILKQDRCRCPSAGNRDDSDRSWHSRSAINVNCWKVHCIAAGILNLMGMLRQALRRAHHALAVDIMHTFFRPVLRLLSVPEDDSGRLSSESSLPSMKALPLTVMGPLPCS